MQASLRTRLADGNNVAAKLRGAGNPKRCKAVPPLELMDG
jgi:hypothetical protein